MGKLSLGKCQPIEIDADNPFKNDALGRKENIENLTQFITSFEQSIVLCIDGGWGQGKTTFIKMWQQYLKNLHIPTIYFNAWESDYTDDALIALIGEISLSLEKLKVQDKTKAEKIIAPIYKYAAKFAKAVAPSAANLSIKAISGGLTNADELAKTLGALGESLVKEQIKKYEESRKTLSKFKEELSKLAQCYTGGDKQKPLVIFIDELDRCRPNFAIEVLEKAKHLFNVDNIIFVLATDKTQLGHSIRAVYGQGLDVNGYLRRFIDFDYLLPLSNHTYIEYLINKYSLKKYLLKKETHYIDPKNFLENMVDKYNLTLREQEAFCNIFNIIVRTKNDAWFDHWVIFICIFLIILKLKFPDIYKNLENKNNSYSDFLDETIKNIDSHCTSDDINSNYYLELLEFLFLEFLRSLPDIYNSNSLEEVIKKNAKKFNFDENKIDRLLGIPVRYGDPCISLPILLDIKNSIEISNSFEIN
ncbi:P-loop NTPase fold protein [Snodgrassella alvi]|uniref:KAP family P-loop NTPase fold protein n=1 Tax=Snodgrassella alvi TaxID=1196083 RepID=UPI00351CA6A0